MPVLGAGAGCARGVRVADTGYRAGCGCRAAGARCVRGGDWALVPGAGAGCVRSGDTPGCIAAFLSSVKKVPVCALELLPMQGAVQKSFMFFAIWGLCWCNFVKTSPDPAVSRTTS